MTADHLLAYSQPPRQFSLRDSLGDTDLRNERSDLIEPFDMW
jgi:hypothetical protein